MDGVNAVSQCPIAGYPLEDTMTYKITAEQYGTTWYHSHYSLQYTNGMYGPFTFYGPSSGDYDDAFVPIMIGDNLHSSSYSNYYKEPTPGMGPPSMDNLMINGIGELDMIELRKYMLISTGTYNCTDDEKSSGVCIDRTDRFNVTVTKVSNRGKQMMLL